MEQMKDEVQRLEPTKKSCHESPYQNKTIDCAVLPLPIDPSNE